MIAAILADLLVGTGSENDWVNILVLGAGVALIATVVKRPNARAAAARTSAKGSESGVPTGDGPDSADTGGGTFAGNPVGCDANADGLVTVADLASTILRLSGGVVLR